MWTFISRWLFHLGSFCLLFVSVGRLKNQQTSEPNDATNYSIHQRWSYQSAALSTIFVAIQRHWMLFSRLNSIELWRHSLLNINNVFDCEHFLRFLWQFVCRCRVTDEIYLCSHNTQKTYIEYTVKSNN